VRYHYFYGDLYPIYANVQNTIPFALIFALIDWAPDRQLGLSIPAAVGLIAGISTIFSWIILRLFYTTNEDQNRNAPLAVGAFNAIWATGVYNLFSLGTGLNASDQSVRLGVGIAFVVLAAGIYAYLFARVGRITIFPNRIKVNNRVFYLDQVKWVEYNVMELEENVPKVFEGKELVVLTPLHYIDEYEDIDILHNYVLLEYKDGVVYVMQPMTYRNHFAGNARNAWLEDWRWEGTQTVPSEDWDKHQRLQEAKNNYEK